MVQVSDFRFAFSDEARQDESRAGAQVRRVDRRPFELRHAFYDGAAPFNADFRPMRLNSSTCMKRFSKTVSVMTLVPWQIVAKAMNWACISVGKPG